MKYLRSLFLLLVLPLVAFGQEQNVRVADGSDKATGKTTDTAVSGDAAGTLSAKLRQLNKVITLSWDNVNNRINVTIGGTDADNSPNSSLKLPVLSARANASAPSWTEGRQVPLSVDLSGALRTSGAGGGGGLTNTELRASAVPVSNASLPLPSGAATSANQTNKGQFTHLTDGTDDALVSGTGSLQVTCDNCGAPSAFSDNSAFTFNTTGITNLGAVVDDTSTNTVAENSSGTPRMSGSRILYADLSKTAANATAIKVDNSAVTQPVSGTVTANAGTGTMAVSGPLTDAQLRATAVPISGTITGITNPLPAGTNVIGHVINDSGSTTAVTQATASNLNAQVVGAAASGASKAGNPVQVGAVFNTTQPTVTNGQAVEAQATARGARIVATGVDTFNVSVNTALPAGSAVIGHVIADSGSTTAVTGNVTVTQGTGTNLHAVIDSGSTTAVTGSVAVTNSGLTNLDSTTQTVANGTAGTKSQLVGGVFNTSPPTLTNGQGSALQANAKGELIVSQPTAADLNATVTGTVAATQSGTWTVQPGNTANTTAWKVDGSAVTQPISAASLPLPTGGATGAKQDTGNGSLSGIDTNTALMSSQMSLIATEATLVKLPVAQTSTTAGQSGPLIQGAVTTGAPTYTTAKTSPLSLSTTGSLRTTCDNCGGSTFSDNGAFTFGTSSVVNIGAVVDDTATNAVTENSSGAPRMTTKRQLLTVVSDPTTPSQQMAINSSGQQTIANTTFTSTQGTAAALTAGWPAISGTVAAGTAAWTSATGSDTALTLTTTGYSTAALSFNPSGGAITAGTITFEASDDGGTTWFPASAARSDGTAAEKSFSLNGTTKQLWQASVGGFTSFRIRLNPVITGAGTANIRLQASNAPPVYTTINDAGNGTTGTATPRFTLSSDSTGQVKLAAGSAVVGHVIADTGSTTAVTGTVTVSGTNNITQFGGTNVSTGTGAGGAGIPRVTISNDSSLAANQSVNMAQVGGTNAVNGGVAGILAVGGNVANAVAATANPVPVGGIFTTTPATLTTGQTATMQFTAAQNLKTDQTTVAGTAVVTAAAGVQKVGIVGNANGALDVANNAAAPANLLAVGFETATQTTTQPTASTAGNMRFGLARTDGVLYVAPHGPVIWSCGLTGIGTTLTQCQAAPSAGLKLYITDVVSQSNTATAGLFTLRFGTGANCVTGTGNVFFASASALMASPGNTVAVNHFHLTVPIAITAANAICVLGVVTNTTNIQINGYTAP